MSTSSLQVDFFVVNQQVRQVTMSVLLHLLPLLVVGCVVLSVRGEQVYKQDSVERATVEKYLKIFQNDPDVYTDGRAKRPRVCIRSIKNIHDNHYVHDACMIITSLN